MNPQKIENENTKTSTKFSNSKDKINNVKKESILNVFYDRGKDDKNKDKLIEKEKKLIIVPRKKTTSNWVLIIKNQSNDNLQKHSKKQISLENIKQVLR